MNENNSFLFLLKSVWGFCFPISGTTEKLLTLERQHKPATIVFPHGLGTDAESRQQIILENGLHDMLPYVKFIFPEALTRKVNIDAGATAPDFGKGQEMPSWFDIQWKWEKIKEELELEEFEKVAKFSHSQLKRSIEQIDKIVQQEIEEGVSTERIIIMGFSQGGTLAATMALASKYKLGGFVILAGWLPNQKKLFKEAVKNDYLNQKTPILFCHGDTDEWVPYWLGKKHFELLQQKGYNVEFISSAGLNHQINQKQIWDVGHFLKQILNPQSQCEAIIESSKAATLSPAESSSATNIYSFKTLSELESSSHYEGSKITEPEQIAQQVEVVPRKIS